MRDLKADALAVSDGLALKADVATTYSKDVVDGLFAEVPTNASVTSALATKVNSADLETYKAVVATSALSARLSETARASALRSSAICVSFFSAQGATASWILVSASDLH